MSQPAVSGRKLSFPFFGSRLNAVLIYSIDLVPRGWLESVPGRLLQPTLPSTECPADRELRRCRGKRAASVTGCALQDIPQSSNGASGVVIVE